MNLEKVGRFICKVRKNKKLTQAELADKIHVTNKAISRWERGIGFPDVSLLEPIAKSLDVTVDELIKGKYNYKNNRKINIGIKVIFLILLITFILIAFINISKNSNSYLLLVKNNICIVPFANAITAVTNNSYLFLIKNIIINIIVSFVIFIICKYISNSNKKLMLLIILCNIILELLKWLTLMGIFDINDIFIRLIMNFVLYRKKVMSNA